MKIQWKAQTAIDQERLTTTRQAKITELKAACSAAIYAGFTSTAIAGKDFGFNETDQANFTQQAVMITYYGGPAKYTAPIQWKTKQGNVETMTSAIFSQLMLEAQVHKEDAQKKYWQLEVRVKAATTVEEIQAVKW